MSASRSQAEENAASEEQQKGDRHLVHLHPLPASECVLLLLTHLLASEAHLLLSLQLLAVVRLIERVEVEASASVRSASRLWRSPGALHVALVEDPAVVFPPEAAVAEHAVGLGDEREEPRRVLAAAPVRVMDEGLFVIGALDLRRRRVRRNPQDVVVGGWALAQRSGTVASDPRWFGHMSPVRTGRACKLPRRGQMMIMSP